MQVLYTSEDYNSQLSAQNHLVVALNDTACAFAVHNTAGALQLLGHFGFYVPLKNDETVFFDFVRSQESLKQKYKSTTVVLQGHKCSLVPAPMFDELYTDSYLRHMYALDKDEVAKTVSLLQESVKLVFGVKEYLFYPARSKYYEAAIEPCAAHYLRKSTRYFQNRLNVFVEKDRLYLVHVDNSQPVFFNSFPNTSVDEAVYFILNYYQTFGISYQNLPLLLHGVAHPQLSEMLTTYAGRVEVLPAKTKNMEVPADFEFDFLIDFCH
ncbi:MAG: DUF3822 family protein [Bacteroidota bacterium]